MDCFATPISSSNSDVRSCCAPPDGAAAANAKRKLESAAVYASASALKTMKMPPPCDPTALQQPKVRRRGSSTIAMSDPCTVKRSLSDGIIRDDDAYDNATAMHTAVSEPLLAHTTCASCPKSPNVRVLDALQKKKSISPRDGISPRLAAGSGTNCSSHSNNSRTCASIVHPARFSDDDDNDDNGETRCPRKHGQLTPLELDCGGAAHMQQPQWTSQEPVSPYARTGAHVEHATPLRVLPSPLTNAPPSSSGPIAVHPPSSKNNAVAMDVDGASANVSVLKPRTTSSAWQPPVKKSRNPGNLSLDLSQMEQPVFDPSNSSSSSNPSDVCLRRNDQAAVCSRVTDFLYVGGAAAAKDRDALLRLGITHILNCAANVVAPDFFPQDFLYYNLRLRDHSSQDIARHFYNVFDFIEKARRRGGRIFVHCVKGISRSPTMAIAYLMWYKRIGMYKALDFIRQARPVVDPNAGFIFQLTEWEQLHREGRPLQLCEQRTVVFRIEVPRESSSSIGNGSRAAEKPLIIGPLTAIGEDYFHNPSKEIAKLSFIVSCADYMFVWCGSDVSDVQVEAAQNATTLLQLYESFPEKYEIVYHGQETSLFWRLVGALRPDEES
ncbi:Mitogen-activated protein kinase phosphatase 1, partial [Globisporangium splendens]